MKTDFLRENGCMDRDGDAEPSTILGLKLLIPPLADYFPEGNLIGTLMFTDLIRWSLNKCAVEGDFLCAGGGQLNDSAFLMEVSKKEDAVARLESLLIETQLREFATVLFFDLCVEGFRAIGPDHANVKNEFSTAWVKDRLHWQEKTIADNLQMLKALLAGSRAVAGRLKTRPENPS